MALSSFRTVSIAVPVGKEEVVVTMYEEYAEDNPGVPIHIKVVGPNGLMTEGKPAAAWQEMLALLGAVPKKPPVRTQHSGMSDCAKLIIEKGEPAAHGLVFAEDGKNSASEQDLQSHEPEVRQVSPEDRNSYIEQKTQRQSQNMAEAGARGGVPSKRRCCGCRGARGGRLSCSGKSCDYFYSESKLPFTGRHRGRYGT